MTTGESSLFLMKILPLKVHINFHFKHFFSLFTLQNIFFLHGVRDSEIKMLASDSSSRSGRSVAFLLASFLRMEEKVFLTLTPGKLVQQQHCKTVNSGSSLIPDIYRHSLLKY